MSPKKNSLRSVFETVLPETVFGPSPNVDHFCISLPVNDRVFLNPCFGKPMVCVRVAFRENDGNHENDENAEDTQTATNKGLSAGLAEITETTKMTKTTGIQGANHGFPKT